jgi:hypothetical protein
MTDERIERGRTLRVGVFVLIGLAAFLGMIYALGARAGVRAAFVSAVHGGRRAGGRRHGVTGRRAIGRVSDVNLPA